MKKVTFNSVKIQNFLSVGEEPIELDFKTGISIITGENKDKGGKNGIGKSTIADAIYWCLFGNTIRELKKDKIQHDKSDGLCKVSLSFTVQEDKNVTPYTITRSLDPAKIEIIVHTHLRDVDVTLSTIPKNDEYIKSIINGNEEVFNNAVIMSANNTLPFMAQKKVDKRKFIEGILQMNIFSEMLLKARNNYNDIKKKNDILSNSFVSLQRNLSTFNDQKTNAETKIQEKVILLEKKYENYENNKKDLIETNKNSPTIDFCNKEIDDLENNKLNVLKICLKAFKKTKDDLVSEYSTISAEIKQLQKDKQKIIDKGNICPTCNRDYCTEDLETVKQKLIEIEQEINTKSQKSSDIGTRKIDIDDKIEEVEDGIVKLNAKIRNLETLKSNVKLYMQKISNIEENMKDCLKQIDEVKKGDSSIDTNIKNTEKEIEKIQKDLTEVKKEMAIIDSVKFIVSEEGVKTYIVKKMINVLNNRLNFYLKSLDAPCKCVFDETFEETLYNEQGKECSYFNFSGGERKRIDTAILFMFQDILRLHSGTSYSLNIYDELLDSALDDKGVDKILDILKTKVDNYNEAVYVISHKNAIKSNIDNVILLEKSNGTTRIVS
jgi:DNA repair exonuclease SbcCD ATPase subunit